MLSSNELLSIIQKHETMRNNDYIVIPFAEIPNVDGSGREYEWYTLKLQALLPSAKGIFVNYISRLICIKRKENTMLLTWTIEIPYGKRSKYIELVDEINNTVTREGSVNLFISNNPYNLCSYLNFEDVPESADKINNILKKHKVKNLTDRGLNEFVKEIALGRKFDLKQIPPFADKNMIKRIFDISFVFSELDALKKKGYDHKVNIVRKKVFISYCHADKKLVYSITDKLENYGTNLWIDKKSIDYSENIARAIISGIDESDLAILFLSNAIKNSNFSQFELENIISNMIKKSMGWFMVKLDDVNVDEIMPSLSNYLYYDFNTDNDINKLVTKIIEKIQSL